MALLFCDSFDHYTTNAQALLKWSNITTGGGAVVWGATGRNATNGMRIPRHDDGAFKILAGAAKAGLVIGVAFRPLTQMPNGWHVVDILDGANLQCSVQLRLDGKLQVVVPGGTAIGSKILNLNIYYYIEIKVVIGNTGSYELRIDGGTELSNGSIDTQASTNATCDRFQFAGGANLGSPLADYDDLYVCDTSGTVNNDFLGDVRVSALFPNGAGANSQWTPFVAGANYTNVDETTPNDDTDYVSDATVGHIDTYAYSDIVATAASIKGIQWIFYARKDDAGTRQIAPVIWQSGAAQVGATQTLGTNYNYFPVVFETNPHTAAAFTLSEINGDEFGVKVIA